MKDAPTVGFIGQGFVGKSYADDFENRGFSVVRYSLEEPYIKNKELIKKCSIVFIAVPTPTTPKGFDVSIVHEALSIVKEGSMVVVKSTLLPGTTDSLQKKFPRHIVLFSPEFLIARRAGEDAASPIMNIVGIPQKDSSHEEAAKNILKILPKSPYEHIMTAREAELFKYVHNTHGFFRVIFSNIVFDLAEKLGANYEEIKKAMNKDPFMTREASYYNNPFHQSGRGAGGVCYIKDFAAFSKLYAELVQDKEGVQLLRSFEEKNIELLLSTNKDIELLKGVYGKEVLKKKQS